MHYCFQEKGDGDVLFSEKGDGAVPFSGEQSGAVPSLLVNTVNLTVMKVGN